MIAPVGKRIPQDSTKLPDTYSYLLCDNLLVSPVFEENGQAEVTFPKGSNWIYYFDEKKVTKGGQKLYYTFGLWETPLFMRANSLIVLSDEILIVAILPGTKINKSILHGSYSDELKIDYS